MRKWTRIIRACVLVLVALLAATAGSGALRPTATTIAADLTITAHQSTVGVAVGAQAVVAVNVSQAGSVLGPIGLTVTGAPVGATVTYPHTVLSGVPAVISVLTAANTPVGSYFLKITATSGSATQTINVKLVVSLPTGFTMIMNPPSRTVVDGSATTYNVTINRGLLAGGITLKVTGLPQYATASASPSWSIAGNSATIAVNVPTNVVPGTYLINVEGKALFGAATASAYLIVVPQTYPDFPLSGVTDRVLKPGSEPGRIDVRITNPFNAAMTVTNLGVALQGTDVPGCAIGNYDDVDYAGPTSLVVPPNSSRTLSQLGVPRAQWPGVRMLNLPVNQDVCQTARVAYKLTATGSGA